MGAPPRAAGDLTGARRLGAAGELAASRILESRGYRVIGAGFLARRGELDLVCRRGEDLVVVEVKSRSSTRFGAPTEAVDQRKRRALGRAATEYRALSGWRGPIRFAVCSVILDREGEVREWELIEDPF